MRAIMDIESDGLLDTITKIHCLCYYNYDTKESKSLISYSDIIEFITQDDLTLVCHNLIRFDIPALKKVLGVEIKARLIDSLALSWYLFPEEKVHGLEEWGVKLGIIKPQVGDWSGDTEESLEIILNRCNEDVKINTELFNLQIEKLLKIYPNGEGLDRFLDYLSFKMDCAREQEEERWRLDVDKCKSTLDKLLIDKETRIKALVEAMPENIRFGQVTKPKVVIKANAEVSVAGAKWYYLLGQKGLSIDHEESVEIEILREPGNPNSVAQIKKWLFDLGWVPQEFKYVKEDNGQGRQINRAIPQISTQDDGICPSIKLLYEKEPKLENLEGLFIIKHRIGILEGWLRDVSNDGYLKAQIAGLTNTLRFQHKTLVNIPTIHKPYGEDLRGCLIAPERMILCGSDCSGLENNTKCHYMMYYDPAYVEEQMKPGYDSHLSVSIAGNMISNHEELFFKWFKSEDKTYPIGSISKLSCKGITGLTFISLIKQSLNEQKEIINKITKVRWGAKRVNFGAIYGASIPKLMLTSGMDKPTTTILYNGYWKKNWSVKQIAKDTHHKVVDGQMWLYNPVSKFWYSLRFEKDKFSTLNQGTGVYCFDTWVSNVRKRNIKICGQFHDEIIFPLNPEEKEYKQKQLFEAIEETNNQLQLNIKLSISVDMGLNYAQIH